MTLTTTLLLLLAIAVEIAREVSFKLGADETAVEKKEGGYLRGLFASPLVLFGFFCWFVEIVAWIQVLSKMSLSIAFPIMSLCYVGTIIASKYILKEAISPRKWFGVASITLGVAIIGSQGIG